MGPDHRRVTLRRQSDGQLYRMVDKSMLGSRTTAVTIEFHRAETNQDQ
jgi:hypothetical protein